MVNENAPYITADELGAARYYVHVVKPQQRINRDTSREMHFTYKMRDGARGMGWLTRNETTDRYTSCLLDASMYNQHVEFIEWSDRINCMVRDGQYISSVNFFMTKEEFAKFLDRVTPAGVAK